MRRGPHRHPRGHHHRGSRKLHVQIFWAFLVMVVISTVVAAGTARLLHPDEGRRPPQFAVGAAQLLIEGVGEGEAAKRELSRRADKLGAEISLWSADGTLVAHTGTAQARPSRPLSFDKGGTDALRVSMVLPDGRSLSVTGPPSRPPHGPLPLVLALLGLCALMGLLSYPLARRITRRLQRLRAGVERFGGGELQSRVEVVGDDEVAEVARAFNAAAERIESLVTQQKRMLASASHELRAPLARLRMAHELILDGELDDTRRAKMLADVEGDIEELDALVADVLMAARLEQPGRPGEVAEVDLSALVAREVQRAGVQGEVADGIAVVGEASMLARLVRNLIDNAKNHGGDVAAVEVALRTEAGAAVLSVRDRGPGVPEEERERIFEPFYRPQGHAETRDGGVGLGLSLVRQIADRHGAVVSYAPRDGGGSEFAVRFGPQSQSQSQP